MANKGGRNEIRYSHVDLVDLVLQLFIRGKLFKKLLFLVFAPSVSVLVVAAHVTARQLGLRVQVVSQTPVNRMQEIVRTCAKSVRYLMKMTYPLSDNVKHQDKSFKHELCTSGNKVYLILHLHFLLFLNPVWCEHSLHLLFFYFIVVVLTSVCLIILSTIIIILL